MQINKQPNKTTPLSPNQRIDTPTRATTTQHPLVTHHPLVTQHTPSLVAHEKVGVWSSPECAYFGLTKAAAVARGMGSAGEGLALYRECLRGCVFSPEGLLKIVYDKQGSEDGGDWVIVGVHVVGEDACELIHYGMELVKSKRTVKDVANSIYSAVTFHELYQIAARAALDPTSARRRRKEAGAAWASLAKKSSRLRSSSKKPNKL